MRLRSGTQSSGGEPQRTDRQIVNAEALVMLEQVPGDGRIIVGGDEDFDMQEFVEECRRMKGTPHVAQNDARPGGSAIDARTTRHTVSVRTSNVRTHTPHLLSVDYQITRSKRYHCSGNPSGNLPLQHLLKIS
jgi:hypothetical protein